MSESIEFYPDEIPSISAEELLDSLTLGVMKNNISQQITGSVESQQNFLSVVIEKFKIIEDNITDPDIKREIQYEIIDFCRELILEIVEFYGLFYNDEFGSSMRVVEILSVLYNFFIIRGEEFICTFFINYIQENRQRLLKELDISEELNNITTISSNKKNIQQSNIIIISNINSIINFIMTNYIEPTEFMEVINDGDFYIETLLGYFQEDTINGDFVNQYITQYLGDESSVKSMELRNKILSAFMN